MWVWFLLGAVLGCGQFAVSLMRRPISGGYPLQAFLVVAALGAAGYGAILWLVFEVIL